MTDPEQRRSVVDRWNESETESAFRITRQPEDDDPESAAAPEVMDPTTERDD